MPRRPRTAYILFTSSHRQQMKLDLEKKRGGKLSSGPKVVGKSGKNMNASNIVTVAIAELWKRTRPQEKRAFEEEAARDMQRFKAEMAAYKRQQHQQHQRLQHQHQHQHQQQEGAQTVAMPPPSPPAQLLSPSPPPMPPRPQKKPAAAAVHNHKCSPARQPQRQPEASKKAGKGGAANAAAAAAAAAVVVAADGTASPAMPRKPPGAFLLWSHKPRGELRKQKDPRLDNGAVSRILGDRWRRLTEEEKAPWIALASSQLDAYLVQKRKFMAAAGLPPPSGSNRNRKRRKTAEAAAATGEAATAQAARAPSVASSVASSSSSSSCSSLTSLTLDAAAGAAGASVRLQPLPPPLFVKGPAPEEKEEDREAQLFWATGGYGGGGGGPTGAGALDGKEDGHARQQQQQQRDYGDAGERGKLMGDLADADADADADDAFGLCCDMQEAGANFLWMDFSDLADEAFVG